MKLIRKGITKVLISELIQIALLLIVIIGLFMPGISFTDANGAVTSGTIIFVTALSVGGIIALIFYLIGVNQAKKQEHEFQLALIMTIVALALQVAVTIFETQVPAVANWIEFGCQIAELIAFESVVTGIVHTAKKLENEKIASIGKKMRVVITIVWIAVIASKVFEFISEDISLTFHLISELAEVIDHIFYLILLITGISILKDRD